jgi:cytochrome b561
VATFSPTKKASSERSSTTGLTALLHGGTKGMSMSLKSKDHRYGSVAIAMHWATAALIVVLFATGLQAAAQTDGAAKVALLQAHVPLGIGVLLMTILRIAWRLSADRGFPHSPAQEPTWRRVLARAVHIGLYVVLVMTAISGVATVAMSQAMPAIIGGATLPDFGAVPPRALHGIMPRLMLVLLAMHIGAAVYHQFILRDRLLARMGLSRQRGV